MTAFEFAWQDRATADPRALLEAVAEVDGRPSLPEDGSVPREFRGDALLVASWDGAMVGLASLTTEGDSLGHQVAELLVHPEHRRRGIGTGLLDRLVARADDTLRVWAHGDQPAAAALAARFGLTPVRRMLRLRLDIDGPLPEVVLPAGIRLRSFVVGQDEAAMIEVNRAAFAWHPEQGSLSVTDLTAAERESWFDPDGFLLAENESGRVIGYHWTKVHHIGGERIGEVYVLGVHPDAAGGGIGRALTLAGLRFLSERRHTRRVMLYVESDNHAALAVYAKLGFGMWDADVQYAR